MHNEEHFESSELIRNIVIGMADGLTVPFALAAGLSGAVENTSLIITAGIAEIAAGSIAMGLGGYLSGRTEIEHYQSEERREYYEVDHFPEKERQEVKDIFQEYGLTENLQDDIVDQLSKDKDKYVSFMMRYELGLEKPDKNRARNAALTIGVSYVVGGLIPLAPYFIFSNTQEALIASCCITILALFVFGYFKNKIIGQAPWRGAFQTAVIGAVAASTAFFIAKLFNS